MAVAQVRKWFLTDYDLKDVDDWIDYFGDKIQYIVIGTELGESGNNLHQQVHVEFKRSMTWGRIMKFCKIYGGNCYLEKTRGSDQQSIDYVKKEGLHVMEYGEPGKQGKRNDVDNIRQMIKDGCNMRDILELTSNSNIIRFAENLFKYHEVGRNWEPTIYWYWGKTGYGKSRTAEDEAGKNGNEFYKMCDATGKWWDGYDGHENVIIEELRSDFPLKKLLLITDRYKLAIEVKGGMRQLRARNIWITSPYHPEDLYKWTGEDLGQLTRRIKNIKYFGDNESEARQKIRLRPMRGCVAEVA